MLFFFLSRGHMWRPISSAAHIVRSTSRCPPLRLVRRGILSHDPIQGHQLFFSVGHLFCTILLLVLVDDHMAFICATSIVERRSSWVLSICFLRMYNRSIKMIHTSTGSPCCVQACRAASDGLSRQRPVGIVVYINYITSHIFFPLCLWVHNCFNLWPICAKQSCLSLVI